MSNITVKKRSVAHLKQLSNKFIQKNLPTSQLVPIIEDKIQVEISQDEGEEEDSDEVEEEESSLEDMILDNVVVIEKANMVPSAELSVHP